MPWGRGTVEFFDSMWGPILVAGGIFLVLVVPALAIVAYRATQRLERELTLLRLELRTVRDRQEMAAYAPHRPSRPVDEAPESATPAAPHAVPAEPVLPEAQAAPEPALESVPPAAPEPPAPSMPSRPVVEATPRGLEQRLGARGFVWLGGACIALAGAFLVKYSIDEGLLGPGMRVALGILLGIALLVAGDFMRRKSGTIGQALTAAGIADLYASLFAAVAMYQLIPPALAFAILAALTFVAIGLSLRHGPFVGLVGLAGGFLTPAIVSTGEPHPAILLGYLYLLQLGALWLERRRGWWYLPAVANAGGLCWALLVLSLPGLGSVGGVDSIAVPIYLIVVAASVLWLSPKLATPADWPNSRIVSLASAVAAAVLMLLWLSNGHFQTGDWAFVALLAILGAVNGRLKPQHEIAASALALVPILGLLAWSGELHPTHDLDRYLWIAGIFGVLGTGGAYGLLWGARNPERWSLLSAIYGATVLAISYWRLRDIELLLPWAIICLILSAVHLLFTERLRNWRFKDRFYRRAFGVHALACAGFLAAAIPLWVEREWLAVLWSLLLPLIAWIANKIEEPWLRRGLWVAVPAVLIAVLDSGFPAGDRPIFNWLAYGLGVPTLCFAATAWLVRRASDLRLMLMLQAGTLILGFLLITLEVRHLFHGAAFMTASFGFGEAGTLNLLWGALALATWRMAHRRGESRLRWIAYGLAALSALLTFGVVWIVANPLLNPIRIYGLPILNSALYVFGSGFLLFMAMARVVNRSKLDSARRQATTGLAAAIALANGFLGVSALNRHLFQGEYIYFGFGRPDWSDAEFYGYSVAWLIYGGLILALAIWRRLPALRHAAAGIVVLVVCKVFLGDASGLTGLYRFASFLGLGLTLLALGYLYQRMLKRAES